MSLTPGSRLVATSGYTTTTGVPLYRITYTPEGSAAERLLVLHGGPGAHHDYLLPQMLRLADPCALVFYDQRGGGRSRTDDHAPITWRTQVDDLAALADELALGPLTIVGYSWGGLLALLYAAAVAHGEVALPDGHAPLVPARLVLIDPAPVVAADRARFEAELARRQASPVIAGERAALAASGLRERDPAAYRQRAFELSVAGYFARPERARDLTPFRVIARVQQSVWESLRGVDLLPRLAAVRSPTIIVHGRQDPIPLDASVAVSRALPDCRLEVLDDCGHVPYVEAPDHLFAAIRRFLEDTASVTDE
jgi:proline iminopeptidase